MNEPKNSFMKAGIQLEKNGGLKIIHCKLHVSLNYVTLSAEAVKKLAKNFCVTTIEEFLKMTKEDFSRLNKKARREILTFREKVLKLLNVVKIKKSYFKKTNTLQVLIWQLKEIFVVKPEIVLEHITAYKPLLKAVLFFLNLPKKSVHGTTATQL